MSLARTMLPLLLPSAEEGGYMPNVAFICGAITNRRTLVLPYALADKFATIATVPLDRLLASMT